MSRYDAVVVGAGILGLAVARAVRRADPGATVAVLECEPEVGAHQTSHNSGVIHSGVYYKPGSLKARLCVEGATAMYEFCDTHGIPTRRCGKLIIARRPGELVRLDELERRGRANKVSGLTRVTAHGIPEIEPNAAGVAALHIASTGIVDYGRVARVLADELRADGVDIHCGVAVDRVIPRRSVAVIEHAKGAIEASRVIVCAGLWSDRVARRSGAGPDPRIVPFRGAYLRLKEVDPPLVSGLVYPVPDPALPFLGVHITPTIDGAVLLGPTALPVASRTAYRLATLSLHDALETLIWPGSWRAARDLWWPGLDEARMAASRRAFVRACADYVPSLSLGDLDGTGPAGVRAQAMARDGSLLDDFVIERDGPVAHVRNAPSPAATSAFALAAEIVRRLGPDT
ncbi:MAG: L-2-hydroxyglutarate oxidase [Ornithinimicrobium sp.]